MPKTKGDATETFAWGALWTIVLLIALIAAAAYFLWYKPVHQGGTVDRARSAVSENAGTVAVQNRLFATV